MYRNFVTEGRNLPKPWEELKRQIYLDDGAVVDEMQCKISPETNLSEIPSSQTRQVAKPLEYYAKKYSDRDTAIFKAYESGAYSMKKIGDYFKGSAHYKGKRQDLMEWSAPLYKRLQMSHDVSE